MATNIGSIAYTLELDTKKFDSSLKAIQSKITGLNSSLRSVDGAASKSSSAINESSATIGGLGKSIGDTSLATAGLVTALALAGQQVFKGVSGFASLQSELGLLKSITNATDDEMQKLKDTAVKLGEDITLPGISAKDAAEAMVAFSKNGIQLNDVLSGSKAVLQLAKISNLDFAESARIVATQLNAFGLNGTEASRVTDLLAKTSAASGTSINELSDAFTQTAAVARQSGLNIDQTSTALGILAKNGLKGSDAGTSLKAALLRLSAPTKESAEALKELGVNVFDGTGKVRDFGSILGDLSNATKGLTDEQKAQSLATIFGTDAIRAASILTRDGAGSFELFSEKINKATGAQGQLEGKTSGLSGTIDKLKSSFETTFLGIGEALAKPLQKIGEFLAVNYDVVEAGILGIGSALLVLAGPLVLNGLKSLSFALKGLVANPVVLAIALIVGALVFLEKKFGTVSKAIEILKGTFDNFVKSPFFTFLKGTVISIFNSFVQIIGKVVEAVKPLVETIGNVLRPVIEVISQNFDKLKIALIALAVVALAPIAIAVGLFIAGLKLLSVALNFIATNFETIKNVILTAMAIAFAPFIAMIAGIILIFNSLKDVIGGVISTIVSAFGSLIAGLTEVIVNVLQFGANLIATVQGFLGSIIAEVLNFVANVVGFFIGLGGQIIGAVAGFAGSIIGQFANLVGGIVSTVANGIGGVTGAIGDALQSALNKAGEFVGKFLEIGKNIVEGIGNGIKNAVGSVTGAVGDTAESIKNKFKSVLGIFSPSKVFAGFGKNIVQGLSNGINSSVGLASSSIGNISDALTSPTATLPITGVSNVASNINAGPIAGIVGQRQVVIAAVPINGIQLSQEQLRDFYRQLTTAYGDDLGAII